VLKLSAQCIRTTAASRNDRQSRASQANIKIQQDTNCQELFTDLDEASLKHKWKIMARFPGRKLHVSLCPFSLQFL